MASAIYLLVIVLSFLGCYCCSFSSTFITLLVLVLPTSFSFIFSKIKHLGKGCSMEVPPASQDEGNQSQADGLVLGSADASPGYEGLDCSESDRPSPENGCSLLDNSIANDKPLPDSSVSDDDSSPENVFEGSISDDDSLIELMLPDGHYVRPEEEPNALFRRDFSTGFLPDFLPESVFRQHGLMELLLDINEEDNLIEIDIAMGSIKCSRFEMKA